MKEFYGLLREHAESLGYKCLGVTAISDKRMVAVNEFPDRSTYAMVYELQGTNIKLITKLFLNPSDLDKIPKLKNTTSQLEGEENLI